MTATVIICSRDGQRMLEQTIASVLTSLDAAGGGELILVDSASRDGTLDVMRRAETIGPVRVLPLAVPGLVRARNAGLAAARGGPVLFTDDDVLVPVQWVSEMSRPLACGVHLVAGTIHLADELAAGLSTRHRELLADTRYMNLGVDKPRTVVGASMGLRGDLYQLGFRFEPQLGAGALGFMDESFMHMQVIEAGGDAVIVAGAPVIHFPAAGRMTPPMWRARARRQGACEAWIDHHWRHDVPTPREWKTLLASEIKRRRRPNDATGAEELELERRSGAARWWARNRFSRPRYAAREVPVRLSSEVRP